MKIKTSELTGKALDWAVAKCEGFPARDYCPHDKYYRDSENKWFCPSEDWGQGGSIIEREHIEWQWLPSSDKAHQYGARKPSLGGVNRTFCMDGPTILIAAMRCYVASKVGDEIEILEEIL